MKLCNWSILLLGILVDGCAGRQPFAPVQSSVPFLVYFSSRHRGVCVGTLVARMVVMTAAVCVVSPRVTRFDTRPVTVIAGAQYRHTGRGLRVQVTKIIVPQLSTDLAKRANQLERSVALMLLKRRVPDALAETPLRSISIDYLAEDPPRLHEECYVPGWHFFYTGDKIFDGHKFHLQRTMRVQAMNVVKMREWCQALLLKYQKALAAVGFDGQIDINSMTCVMDGMYGAPLICHGRAVGMMTAPDAQWRNCTGYSVIMHLFGSESLRNFFSCVNSLFDQDVRVDPEELKRVMYQDPESSYDYAKVVYSHLNADISGSQENKRR